MSSAEEPAKAQKRPRKRSTKRQMALRDYKVIELLAAGFPIEEIAAREGISARRARGHAAAALARRTLDPPAHFAQLQIRRLSEALLVCTSAMSRGNLQAVDRVVKIVRELDRYHGFGPAAAAPRLTAPAPDSPAQLLAPPLALAPPTPTCEPALAPTEADEPAGDGASVG